MTSSAFPLLFLLSFALCLPRTQPRAVPSSLALSMANPTRTKAVAITKRSFSQRCDSTFSPSLYHLCPMNFTRRFINQKSYKQFRGLEVKRYLGNSDPHALLCDAFCNQTTLPPLPPSFGGAKASPLPRGKDHARPLPWCRLGEDSIGRWVPREEFWEALQRHSPQGQHDHERMAEVMGGDVHAVMNRPHVWVPSNCRLFRYNLESIYRCADRWRALTNTTLWVYFLGDSTSRGTFCDFLRLFTPGGECSGAVGLDPCHGGTAIGEIVHTSDYFNTEITHSCVRHPLNVSFHFMGHSHNEYVIPVFANVFGGAVKPTHVIYNSGAWDYDWVVTRHRQLDKKGRMRLVKSAPRRPPSDEVERARPGKIRYLLNLLRTFNYSGALWFRNNPCNALFSARLADAAVEAEFRRDGWGIVDIYNFTVCRRSELLRDRHHFDLNFAREAPKEKPSLGELTFQISQSILNAICNPILLPR